MTSIFYGDVPGAKLGKNPGSEPGAIELEIIRTLHCSRMPVYDGPTRLYDQWDYECIAIWNPGATAYSKGDVGKDPRVSKGTLPVFTDEAIQARLLEPRRQLHMLVGNTPLLSCPMVGMQCDSANGPMPYRLDILEIVGERTFIVRWGVRCFVNPCRQRVKETAAVLSHRWAQERMTDTDGFSQLITRGHAIFDVGKLLALGGVPDVFWNDLANPLEVGFRRDSVQVVATEDGTSLEYCVVDREMPMTLLAKGVSRIEAYHTATIGKSDIGKVAKRALADSKTGADIGGDIGGVVPIIGQGIGRFIGRIAGGISGAVSGSIPTMTHTIVVRLWGHQTVAKRNLAAVGKHMVMRILAASAVPLTARKLSGYTNSITRDVAGRYAEVHCQFNTNVIFAAIDAFEKKFGFFSDEDIWPHIPAADTVTDFLGDAVGENPPLPGGPAEKGGTRGTWIGRIVAQALTSACERQPGVPHNIKVGDTVKDKGGL